MTLAGSMGRAVALGVLLAAALGTSLIAQAVDISGAWTFTVTTDAGSGTPAITFKQSGEALTGTYAGTLGNAEFKGTVKGNAVEFSFTVDAQGQTVDVVYRGNVEKTTMKGTVSIAGGQVNGTFTGARK